MKSLPLATLAALAFSLLSASSKEITFEAWSYTGTDIFPSALIATATVNWHADADAEAQAEEETGNEPAGKAQAISKAQDNSKAGKAKADDAEVEEALDEIPILGDPNGWIGARLFDVPEGAKIKVEVSGEGWLKPSRTEVTIEEETDQVIIMPKGVFDFDALGKIRQQRPAVLTLKVSVNGKKLPDQTENVILRSINECPFFVNFEDAESDDLSWMFAAYVNENHPWIDGILKDALDAGLVDSFDGYQSGNPEKVAQQVFAIWHVMQRKGIRYSDITATPRSKFANSQTVRFLDDSVKASQANCVDGSVIFASILTKLSVKCGLVLVPGHCFVCFDLDPDGALDPTTETCIGLETTLLGAGKLKPMAELAKLPDDVKVKTAAAETDASAKTFLNAIATAGEVFKEHGEEFLDDKAGVDYQIIPIDDARELGIMPLAAPDK